MTFRDTVLAELRRARGIDFAGYDGAMLARRIAARMARLQIAEKESYIEKLRNDPAETDHLIDAISINVSSFFRNPLTFEIMAQDILPQIAGSKKRSGSKDLRIWSAGCAAGEEPYSVAILVDQLCDRENCRLEPHIFATDIDTGALQAAVEGIYPKERLAHAKLGVVEKYFSRDGDSYRIAHSIKKMVWFSQDDLTSVKTVAPSESIFGSFDLILCRNVLIYFSPELRAAVFTKLHKALNRDGYLVLGDSEFLDSELEPQLEIIDRRNRIFRKR